MEGWGFSSCQRLMQSMLVSVSQQVKSATSPTPSSLTFAATNACTLTAAHRSNVRTVGKCSAPPLPSTSTGASVKGRTTSQQEGCLPRVCHSLGPPAWTNQLLQWVTAVQDLLIILGLADITADLRSLLPQHFLSASLACSPLDFITGRHSFLPQLLLSDSHPTHLLLDLE